MREALLYAGALALPIALLVGNIQAQEAGLADMHEWVTVGGTTCLADHFHDGSGSGATRAQAQAAAIRAWTDFTVWEYGSPWGRYGSAVSKSMSCSRSDDGWSCSTSARPCRSR